MDDESNALRALTGQLLELLYAVGVGAPAVGGFNQWIVDTSAEIVSQIEALRPFTRRYGVEIPVVKVEIVEEAVRWICETASLPRQRDAIACARPHDWVRARRLARLAIGLHDRAIATASPHEYAKNPHLFTRVAVGWARLLLPILLAVVRMPEQCRSVTDALFLAAAIVRGGRHGPHDDGRSTLA